MYVHDARGRITAVNQWDDSSLVPRFHLILTAEGPLCRFRADVPDALAAELTDLAASERLPEREPIHEARYQALLSANAPIERIRCGPAFVFPPAFAANPNATPLLPGGEHLLQGGLEPWRPDVPHRQPFYAAIEDGRAVAICCSARIGTVVHEAGVETDQAYRRRGFALRAVAAWALAVQAAGVRPHYSTTWDNTASQAIAARLGLIRIGTDYSIV